MLEEEEDDGMTSPVLDGEGLEGSDGSNEDDESYSVSKAIGRPPTDDVLELLGIPTQFGKDVVVCDMWNNLQLIHYTECYDDSPNFIKHARGIVVDVVQKCIVCRSAPFTTEIVSNDIAKAKKYIPDTMEDVCVHKAAEGTVIRVFYDGTAWLWTTHHNLDAFDSKWGNTTFGDMFKECINASGHKTFDRNICYVFLMSHPENTIVCHDQEMYKLYLIAAYTRNGVDMSPIPLSDLPELKGIVTTGKMYSSLTRDALLSMTARANIADLSGYILRLGDIHIKLSNPHYMMFRNIRGDNPNINIRYLELTRGRCMGDAQKFIDMNARYSSRFNKMEDEIRQLCPIVYNYYIGKYVTKRCTNVPTPEYIAVRYIHQWHIYNRRTNVVTKEKVARLINEMSPSDIWKLIRDRISLK
jgi:hypothetical protein